MIQFRNATPDDATALARLGARSFTETFGHLYDPADLALFLANHQEETWRDELDDPAKSVRVGECDGELVAYAKLTPPKLPFVAEQGSIELGQFYILKPWHGTGAARDLMAWVLEKARERFATALYLSVFTDNHRARRFYLRHGFKPVGTYAFMVGTHADEDIVMRLEL